MSPITNSTLLHYREDLVQDLAIFSILSPPSLILSYNSLYKTTIQIETKKWSVQWELVFSWSSWAWLEKERNALVPGTR